MTSVFIIATITLLGGTNFSQADAQESNTSRPRVHVFYVGKKTGDAYQKIAQRIEQNVKQVQRFYSEEMERHGYAGQTFLTQLHSNGKLVKQIHLKHDTQFYINKGEWQLWAEVLWLLGVPSINDRIIRLFFVDIQYDSVPVRGRGWRIDGSLNGIAYVYRNGGWVNRAVAHELGHAFGLLHDWRNQERLMYSKLRNNRVPKISPGAAKWLSRHPAFNRKEVDTRIYDSIADFKVICAEKHQAGNKHRVICTFTMPYYPIGHNRYRTSLKSILNYAVFLNVEPAKKDSSVIRFIDEEAFSYKLVNNRIEYTIRFNAELPANLNRIEMQFLSSDGHWNKTSQIDWKH